MQSKPFVVDNVLVDNFSVRREALARAARIQILLALSCATVLWRGTEMSIVHSQLASGLIRN